jgi:hypothetical protein
VLARLLSVCLLDNSGRSRVLHPIARTVLSTVDQLGRPPGATMLSLCFREEVFVDKEGRYKEVMG